MREQRTRGTRGVGAILISIALIVGLAGTASAATLIGNWKLKGDFKNTKGTVLKLAGLGDVEFATTDVNGTSRQALVFDAGEGLRLTRVPRNARASYSISIWFELDDIGGYKRIMAFGPNDTELGLYSNNGATELYDLAESSTQDLAPDTWARLHLTRDAKTNRVKVYVDGTQAISYKDYREAYRLFLGRGVLFVDDNGEHGSGTVAAVKVWRGVKAP